MTKSSTHGGYPFNHKECWYNPNASWNLPACTFCASPDIQYFQLSINLPALEKADAISNTVPVEGDAQVHSSNESPSPEKKNVISLVAMRTDRFLIMIKEIYPAMMLV